MVFQDERKASGGRQRIGRRGLVSAGTPADTTRGSCQGDSRAAPRGAATAEPVVMTIG